MRDTDSPKQPPNYSSRTMQWRLLVLVGGLMLVLVMMDEARKPENWMWMGFETTGPQGDDEPGRVSPRLSDLFSQESADNSLFKALVRSSDEEDASPPSQTADLVSETLLQVLRRCFQQLSDAQLQQLFVDVGNLRALEPLASETQAERFLMADRLERVVQVELAEYRRLSRSDEIDRDTTWDPLLEQVQQRFAILVELLRSGGLREDLTIGQLQELNQLQQLLDQVALEQIEDNTLGPRAREQHAWYRTFELMAETSADSRPATATRVTSFDLAEQPTEYRGKWVEIHGQVRELRQVSLKNNRPGYQDYWELWVRPDNGPDVPICVYAQQLPASFPRPPQDETSLSLKESVVIDGCFFKNMSYRAVGGLRVSPLVLTATPNWQPEEEGETGQATPLTLQAITTITVICLLVSCLVAWLAYRSTRLRVPKSPSPQRGHLSILLLLGLSGAVVANGVVTGQDSEVAAPAAAQQEPMQEAGQSLPPWLVPKGDQTVPTTSQSLFDLFQDIKPSELDRLGDFADVDPNEPIVQQILARLEVIGPRWLESRSRTLDTELARELSEQPSAVRGQLVTCRGRIQSVEMIELSDATWNQFERDVVYRVELACDLANGQKQAIIAITNQVPAEWESLEFPRDEARLAGVFVHLEATADSDAAVPMMLAHQLAWFPRETPLTPWQQYWSDQGFDFGRWQIAKRQEGRPLQAEDGACFYALLSRASTARLQDRGEQATIAPFDLFEVLRDPNEQRGAVFELDGIAKRITRIPTGQDLYANDEQVEEYYQIDLLLPLGGKRVRLGTQDNGATLTGRYPLTICVTDLPPGIEVGDDLNQRIHLVAAFYRNWKYRSEYLRRVDDDLRQLSPLLIGISVEPQGVDESAAWLTQIAVGVFVIAMVLTGIGYLYLRRSDQKYARQRAELKSAELPEQLDWTEPPQS